LARKVDENEDLQRTRITGLSVEPHSDSLLDSLPSGERIGPQYVIREFLRHLLKEVDFYVRSPQASRDMMSSSVPKTLLLLRVSQRSVELILVTEFTRLFEQPVQRRMGIEKMANNVPRV
jgi:hypothetical protein